MGFFEKLVWAMMAQEAIPYILAAIAIAAFLWFFFRYLKELK